MNVSVIRYLIATLLFILANQAMAAIPQIEREALLALYSTTSGANWHNNSGWKDVVGTECNWHGVSCDADESMVTGLDLKANNIKGPLPAELKNLNHLISSDFRYNGVYSDNAALVEFLDATSSVGSLMDTQTIDPNNASISHVTESAFNINWDPVVYEQAGGYRIYLASQIEDGVITPYLSEFVKLADINNKAMSSYSISGLKPCAQYFVKVTSYTSIHEGSASEVESDGKQLNILGTIPNWNAGCDLKINSSANISFIVSYKPEATEKSITIEIDQSANMTYTFVYPGEAPASGDIPGACYTSDGVVIIGDQTEVLVGQSLCTDIGIEITLQETPSTFELVLQIPHADIEETAEIGSLVTTLSGYLAGSTTLSYVFTGGNDGDAFAITNSNNEGVITVNGVLDYDTQSSYMLEVKIENEKSESVIIPVQVTILPVANETAKPPAAENAAGCSLHTGAPFDPIWLMMLLLAGFYQLSRLIKLK